VVKGSSKSMEEVTRVSHFVGSSGEESKRKREGEREGVGGDRVILQTRSRPERWPPAKVVTFDTERYQGWRNRHSP